MSLDKITRPLNNVRRLELRTTTVRDFSGGLNVIDNDLNLASRFARVLDNMERGVDGTIGIRAGTEIFADLSSGLSDIINMVYYNQRVIVVDDEGTIASVDGQGAASIIWNETIAASRSGAPKGWGPTSFVSFAHFRGSLIICNGSDKPVIVRASYDVNYLVDNATGSNLNVPVARYVMTSDRYLLMSGDVLSPDKLYISNVDSSGTWYGDPQPNDAVNIDLGGYIRTGSQEVRGIGKFRDRVVIAFDNYLLPIKLGVYNSSNVHEPLIDDAIEQHGSVAHRVIQSLGDDMLFCDAVGVPSLRRALFTGALQPERASQLIDPLMQQALDKVKTTTGLEDLLFSIYEPKTGSYKLFVPNATKWENVTETVCFSYLYNQSLKIAAWARLRGWKFRCGCVSQQGNVFLANGAEIYRLGTDQAPVSADYVGMEEMFSDDTVFDDGRGWSPASNDAYGIPICFDWHLPWADFDQRMLSKNTRYIALDTYGTAQFDVDVFVDNFMTAPTDTGEPFSDDLLFTDSTGFKRETPEYVPTWTSSFVGGDYNGYGGDDYGRNFGGGRPARTELLYDCSLRGKIFKYRVHGETVHPLQVVSLSAAYQQGTVRR